MSIALALKYRPIHFDDLIGQNTVSQTLRLALDGDALGHAYLFSGLRGSGKTSSARIFARALQCEKGPSSIPCDQCDNCQSALQGRHLDIIEMDAASNRGIDDIKNLIEQTKYRSSLGRYKIFIIDEVHMLTPQAFNALLKTLEEPPEYVKFILATTDPLKLPATILSRTQHFRFKQIPLNLVTNHISNICHKEEIKAELPALEIIARSGNGSLRDTLTLLDQAMIFCEKDIRVDNISDMLGIVDPNVLEDFFTAILNKDDEKSQTILNTLSEYETDNIIDEMIIFLKNKLEKYDKNYPLIFVDRFFRILADGKRLLHLNTNGNFILLLIVLKLREALKLKDVENMIKDLEDSINKTNISNSSKTLPIEQGTKENIKQENIKEENTKETDLFSRLIEKMYDRNVKLGNVFKQNVDFDKIDGNTLYLKSRAQGEDKEYIRSIYGVIRSIISQIYGENIIIKVEQQESEKETESKEINQEKPSLESKQEEVKSTSTNTDKNEEHKKFLDSNKEIVSDIKATLGIDKLLIYENGTAIKNNE